MSTKVSRGRVGDEPNPIDVHVGQRVRMYRSLRGMSQEKLAEELGVTFQQVQKYETGYNRISASRLWDISQVLNTPIVCFYQDMSSEVTSLSPRHITEEKIDTASSTVEQISQLYNDDPMARRETLSLVRAYYKIPDRSVAHKIFDLITKLAADVEYEVDVQPQEQGIKNKRKTKKQK